MIVLGVDPGTAITGFGVIEADRSGLKVISFGCITTSKDLNAAERLKDIHLELTQLIKKYKPGVVAVEDLFFFKNLKTAIGVAQARGVILCCAKLRKIAVEEYTPLQVKQAVSGYGRADKKQVQEMVKIILNLKQIVKPDDAADALAIAICCAHSINL